MIAPRLVGRRVSNVVVAGVPSADTVEAAGSRWFNASSSDLLGLAADLRVQESIQSAIRRYSFARDASTEVHRELTEKLQHFFGRESAIVSHPASLFALPHAIDAVNSLDGAIAPLPKIFQESSSPPIVLDRLGLGILGEQGRGAVEHLGVDAPIVCSALGGGVPGSGLVVNAPKELLAELEADALPPPTPALAGTLRALQILEEEKHRRERLLVVGERLFSYLRSLGLDTGPSVTPWIPVWLGEEDGAHRWMSVLSDARIAVAAWLSPGSSRLLLSIPATASDAQLEALFVALRKAQRKFAPPEGLPDSAPTIIARPGTFATSIPAHPRWMPMEVSSPVQSGVADHVSPSRLRDILENFTWKLANVSGGSLERLSEVLRRGKPPGRP